MNLNHLNEILKIVTLYYAAENLHTTVETHEEFEPTSENTCRKFAPEKTHKEIPEKTHEEIPEKTHEEIPEKNT